MSIRFVCCNCLKQQSNFLGVSEKHAQDMKNIFYAVCCRYCWVFNAFYRTQISLIDPRNTIFVLLGDQNVKQYPGCTPTQVNYLKFNFYKE